MPAALAAIPVLGAIVSFASTAFGSFVISVGLTIAATAATYLINDANKPVVPKASDGKYNLKQNVPDLCRVYGRVKKGGDYLFLEEIDGVAFHILCVAAVSVSAYATRWGNA